MSALALDHLVYAAADVPAAVAAVEARFGVRPALGGHHIGVGTYNHLLALGGGTYLEIIGPDPGQPTPSGPLPFGLGLGRPDRLAGFAVRASDLAHVAASAREAGYDPGEVRDMQRATPDGAVLRWQLATRWDQPFDGLVPFLIDWFDTPHPSTSSPTGCTLAELRLVHPDAGGVRAAYRALGLDLSVSEGPQPGLVAVIDTPKGRCELSS
jgi:hypothetical protein